MIYFPIVDDDDFSSCSQHFLYHLYLQEATSFIDQV